MMQQILQSLLSKLDAEERQPWFEEMRHGKPVYDFMFERLSQPGLTELQLRNGLYVLFKLRGHGDQEALFEKYLEFVACEKQSVRSAAVGLLVGMLKASGEPGFYVIRFNRWDFLKERMEWALAAGVDSPARGLALKLLDRLPT